ncbi:alpha/beta hydrolase [Nocardia brasiliensis]|uniref:alpha/beta hydrolase n=1 Tax=Nocardia brasiliensis TaxID=37326 RepID=UPI003D9411F3
MQTAADVSVPRPVIYLLLGAGGGADGATWSTRTDVLDYLLHENINVVMPLGGRASYYADWRNDDPYYGRQRWKTFLTQELPPLIDDFLGANGRNGIAGFSMSATSVLALAATVPQLYSSVASYSGCAQISDPIGQRMVQLTVGVETRGLLDVKNMYGAPGDPMWAANDPFVQAEGLRGKAIYVSSGSGLAGELDIYDGKYSLPGLVGLVDQLVIGGAIEAVANFCTHNLKTRLDALGIEATYNLSATGTHSWGYWEAAFKDSWHSLAAPLGM